MSVKPILILGIGNILQHDDGIGIHVIHSLLEEDLSFPDVEFYDGATAGMDLIPVMEDRESILVIDALRVNDEPGSLYRFGPEDARAQASGLSLHEFGILQAVHLLGISGHHPRVEIIGVVPEDINTITLELSPRVANRVPEIVSLVKEIINDYRRG